MIGSLFSGIGGLDLALEWAGFGPTVFQVEIDPWCRAVLAKHWPLAERFNDVRQLSGATLPVADVWCGGFPCQDISSANPNGKGLDGARSGLWFEFRRLLDEAREAGRQPRGVIVENVGRLARRGLDVVAGGLIDLGYSVDVSRVLAAHVGAPHLRERCFLVAYADSVRRLESEGCLAGVGRRALDGGKGGAVGDTSSVRLEVPGSVEHGGRFGPADGAGEGGGVADDDRSRREGGPEARIEGGIDARREPELCHAGGADFEGPSRPAAEPRVGRIPHGLPHWVDGAGPDGAWPSPRGAAPHAWEPPRTLAGVVGRPARLRGLGNAVSPQQGLVAALRLREQLGVLP